MEIVASGTVAAGIPSNSRNSYGFFSTTFPFSQTMIGVPCILAILRTLRGIRRIARATESKNRLFSGDIFFFI
jgi:hypothetical protein